MKALGHFWRALPSKLREEDKVKHMVWSFVLTVGALCIWSIPVALVVVFALGLAKECWDARYGSGFCFFDMAGNCVGSAVALLCSLPLLWWMA